MACGHNKSLQTVNVFVSMEHSVASLRKSVPSARSVRMDFEGEGPDSGP